MNHERLNAELFAWLNQCNYQLMTRAGKAKMTKKIKRLKKEADKANIDFKGAWHAQAQEILGKGQMTTDEWNAILKHAQHALGDFL